MPRGSAYGWASKVKKSSRLGRILGGIYTILKIDKTGDRPVLSGIIKHLWHTRFKNISCIRLLSDSIVSIH